MKNIMNWQKFNEEMFPFGNDRGNEYLELGTTPADEECVQVSSSEDYIGPMKVECRRYIDMLKKRFPNCTNVQFSIKSCTHDFGTYYEVVVYYDDRNEGEAYFIENNLPQLWSDSEVLTYTPDDIDDDFIKESLAPKVIITDEMIKKKAEEFYKDFPEKYKWAYMNEFKRGAQWYKEQLCKE